MESTEYEPEQFLGFIYRPSDISAVALIFANGKTVITGAQNLDIAERDFDHLYYRVQDLG